MIVLYILAGIGAIMLLLLVVGALAGMATRTQLQLTQDQARAVKIITEFLNEQAGGSFPGRAKAVAKFVKELPARWAAGVASGFISPADAAVTLMYEPDELGATAEQSEQSGFSIHEETAFWALNNAWARLMRGLMPRLLQVKLEQYVRGFDEARCKPIASDWEAARSELCNWAQEMVDHECPNNSKLFVALRSAQMEPTRKIPSDFDATYTITGEESPSWIR